MRHGRDHPAAVIVLAGIAGTVVLGLAACGKSSKGGPSKRVRCERVMLVDSEIEKCMAWTEPQLRCMETDSSTVACDKQFAAMLGLQHSDVKAEGPAPAWQLAVHMDPDEDGKPGEIHLLHAAGGGTVAVQAGNTLIAVAGGVERWRATVPGLGPVAAGTCLAVAGDHGVRCLDAASGEVRWRTRAPTEDERAWVLAAWRGDRLLLIREDGTVAVADPAACTADPAGATCLMPRPPLEGAYNGWSLTRGVAVAPDGGWFYVDDRLVAVVGPGDTVLARFAVSSADSFTTDPAVTSTGLGIIGWDDKMHRLDPAACKGALDAAPPETAPAGCITAIADRPEGTEGWGPRSLIGDGVAFAAGNELHVWRGGKKHWAAEISFALVLVGSDPVIYTGGAGIGALDLPAEVRAVSLTDGTTLWRTKLPTLGSTGLFGPMFTGDDDWLYIATRTHVAALPRRATP